MRLQGGAGERTCHGTGDQRCALPISARSFARNRRRWPPSTLPFRAEPVQGNGRLCPARYAAARVARAATHDNPRPSLRHAGTIRSEEHTSELQSRENLVCRLLLEKKK